jgi:hypothetical protein
VTGYHKFYDEADGWQQVVQLDVGDTLRTRAGDVEVLAVERVDGTHRVYNMTVEADHVYYVGDLTTLTHNTCPWEVGNYNKLQAASDPFDGLHLHHAGQKHPMSQLIPGYDPRTGPSIAVPVLQHQLIPNMRGPVPAGMTARSLLAQDVRNLRNLTDAPNSALKDLVDLNKTMYPGSFAR